MKKVVSMFLMIALIIFASFVPASAYSLPSDNFWVGEQYVIYFRPHYLLGATSVTHMNDALWQWNARTLSVANRSVVQRYTSSHYLSTYPTTDEMHCVYKLNMSNKKLAEATTRRESPFPFIGRKQVYDADILINSAYAYSNGAANGYDFWTVFLHESGHTIGLNHSSFSDAVMKTSFGKGELVRYLSQDDKNGVSAVYG